MEIVISIVIGLAVGVGLMFMLRKKDSSKQDIEDSIKQVLPELMKSVNEQVIQMADQKLGAEKKEIRADMEGKRNEIERLIKMIREDLNESKTKLSDTEKERANMFGSLKNSLDEYKKITDQLAVSTESLKKVLSNNQLRGQFGEQVADELLKMAGFVRGVDYEFNKEQAGSETRPDFCVFLPDGTRINVDSKFPYSNLQKSSEATSDTEKREFLRLFERDVREKIKQVTTRDYINPEDKTVDFVILFIPNEMIFSYIYDQLNSVWKEAMEKKVILAGPFSFSALLRMIKQSYDNFRVQENIQKIVGYVRGLEKEFVKFSEEFGKFGDRIQQLNSQYEVVSRTRVNQMNKAMEKVRLEGPDDSADNQPRLLN
ncbi:MAG: RmuC-domain protein [candidate division WS6 bacterium GW2011_GWF2_39_15]|uniref:RmuC-domain protein n=1 Tax=candidate division WS6 bacterium GW2011_GWF2_39_15 TaxID=1619100 RepID=A0A0G0QWE8_9BACT|nr:MAG: RmuC-domain protein [candidate division WS6 bacterium GW2011_GWF2_39_15]